MRPPAWITVAVGLAVGAPRSRRALPRLRTRRARGHRGPAGRAADPAATGPARAADEGAARPGLPARELIPVRHRGGGRPQEPVPRAWRSSADVTHPALDQAHELLESRHALVEGHLALAIDGQQAQHPDPPSHRPSHEVLDLTDAIPCEAHAHSAVARRLDVLVPHHDPPCAAPTRTPDNPPDRPGQHGRRHQYSGDAVTDSPCRDRDTDRSDTRPRPQLRQPLPERRRERGRLHDWPDDPGPFRGPSLDRVWSWDTPLALGPREPLGPTVTRLLPVALASLRTLPSLLPLSALLTLL